MRQVDKQTSRIEIAGMIIISFDDQMIRSADWKFAKRIVATESPKPPEE